MNEKTTRNPVYGRPRDPLDPGTSACIHPCGTPPDAAADARRYITRYAKRREYTTTELAQILAMLGLGEAPADTAPPAPPTAPSRACGTIPGWLTHVDHLTAPCGPCAAARAQYPAARTAPGAIDRARGRGIDMPLVIRAADNRDRVAAASLTADERLAAAVRVVMAGGLAASVSRRLNIGWADAKRIVDLLTADPIAPDEAV